MIVRVLIQHDQKEGVNTLLYFDKVTVRHCISRMGHAVVVFLISAYTFVSGEQYTTTENYDTTLTSLNESPTKALDLTVVDITSNSIYLTWREPRHTNGPIEGYRIYFIHANFTDVRTVHVKGVSYIKYNLTNLYPDSEYKLWVTAFTPKHEGEPSEPVVNRTDIDAPTPPRILNLTCQTQNTILVQWQRPYRYYNSITFYYIYLMGDIFEDDGVIELVADPDHLDTSYSIKNVTVNARYIVRLGASTFSTYTGRLLRSNLTDPVEIIMKIGCHKRHIFLLQSVSDLSAGMIAGVVCAITAFVLAISSFVLWRKFFSDPYYYLDDPANAGQAANIDWNTQPKEAAAAAAASAAAGTADTAAGTAAAAAAAAPAAPTTSENKGPIPVEKFSRHVAELHADGDIGFSKEYEVIQSNQEQHTSEHSQHPENRVKNRYLNIIAYDHSRVQLLQIPGQKRSIDYINANYIDGFLVSKAYIGTQGPLPSTFDCFWRMVWEQRVTIIVMITNLVERGRDTIFRFGSEHFERKCDMYWPKEGSETYGIIQVKLVREDVMATYTVRTLLIRHTRVKKKKASMAEKIVYQYHYTNWPDHGTPDHPLPVLHFVKKSSSANPEESGPIIVHCSAGVGRTGTYIVVDAMMRQIRERNEVNIFGFLRHIRGQRNFLVQTEEQYIFIHDAILEAIESGETYISREQFPRYLEVIQGEAAAERSLQWKHVEDQFKMVTNFKCKDFNTVSATKVINQPKNRRVDIVPIENSRVHLTPKPGEEGSDYVNATWLQGFHSLREFIITQHPLRNTLKDFWQMVWDHNAQTIVMLSIIDNQDFEVFWPCEQEIVDAENFRVKMTHEHLQSTYVFRDFILQSLQDDYELNVRMVHCPNWPNHCSSPAEIYHLPNTVQDTQLGYQNGPIVVVDRYGAAEAATFCCLISLKKHILYDDHVDVYMYAKLYHNKRPGIWNTVEEFLRVHLAVLSFCYPPEDAADFNAATTSNGAANGTVSNDNVRVPPEESPLISREFVRLNK